jgi:glycosyltransferase involved in cell wall biosynthesis
VKVLVAHNAYQHRGGEDSVVDSEIKLLADHGHDVRLFSRHNDELATMTKVAAVRSTLWSSQTMTDLWRVVAAFQPDVIHVHNTFPLISPSLYWAAAKRGIPIVQTLHNFRLFCPQAMLLRDGRVCEDCLGKLPWRGVLRVCYRDSVAQSGVLASMTVLHRALGTYRNKVTRYIALNDFCRQKFIEGGLPAERVLVKPNFVDMPPPGEEQPRNGFLFVGRLSQEKGIATLAESLRLLPSARLTVVGAGPEMGQLEGMDTIRLMGFQSPEGVRAEMCAASALVMPSIWYENFPRTLVEAFACGLPVIASRLGAMAELIEDGETGLLFEPGNVADLAVKMRWAIDHLEEMQRMGAAARAEYEAKYTAEQNYKQLMAIYAEAIEDCERDD